VTLIIGVVSSLFTALFMTRYFFRWWLKAFPKTELTMMHWIRAEKVAFVRHYQLAMIAVATFVGLGVGAAVIQKDKLLGMDFTGGYTFEVKIHPEAAVNGRALVENAFKAGGIPSTLYTLRQLNDPHHLKVFLSPQIAWEEVKGLSLLARDETLTVDSKLFNAYQLLKASDVPLAKSAFEEMKRSFNHVSGQMSDTMRNQALMGIGIALFGILIYIAIRFEWKYAVASTLGLGVDIIITLAALALLNLMGLAIQFDLNMVAALLTIVGYSLNDTIIVFDRIREELKRNPHGGIAQLLDPALNMTLSRTLLTSGTTLLVLVVLALLGGSSIFGFSLVMAIGVLVGTLSTFFVATPLLLLLEKKGRPMQQIAAGVST
jgi:SecD/SecF fusion protein